MVYKIINKIFFKSNIGISAAEAHGVATGMLCGNEQATNNQWLDELFKNSKPDNEEGKNLLVRLFEETRRLLDSDGFELELFLPDEDSALSEQVEALRDWCKGFLFGLGLNASITDWPDDMVEIVKDITEFTKLETKAAGEEDEKAFTEITEYLRSVVVLLHDDIKDLKYSQAT